MTKHFVAGIVITVYEAFGPMDTTEGKSPGTICYGFYRTRVGAERMASDKGVMGTPGYVKERLAYQLADGKIHVFENNVPLECADTLEEERASALAKLSPREREVLGIE